MLEIVNRIASHSKTFHDTSRSDVLRNGHGNDFAEASLIEGKGDARARGLCRIAPSPVLCRETPSHFDARREMCLEWWNSKTHEPYKRDLAEHFDGPQSETMPVEMRLDALDDRIALRAGQDAWEVLHHADVRIEFRERTSICTHPAP